MTFLVQVPEAVQRKVSSFDLPHAVLLRFYEAPANDLSNWPTSCGKIIVAPVRCTIFTVVVNDPGTDLDYHFKIWVNETRTPGVRFLLDVACQVPDVP